jgi:hypothetical protein
MATSRTKRTLKPQAARKAVKTSKATAKPRSGSSKRAQPRATRASKADIKSMAVPIQRQTAPRPAKRALAGASRQAPHAGSARARKWFAEIEAMMGSEDGRDILADALRAFANVLSRRSQDERPAPVTRSRSGVQWPVNAKNIR